MFFLAEIGIGIFAVALTSGLFSVPVALAQEKEQQHEADEREKAQREYNLETVTVTAEKREENVQEVPTPITALTEIMIEDADVQDVGDIVEFVPNMSFRTSYMEGTSETNFRGIHLSQFTEKNPVVIFIDGIPQDGLANYDTNIINVERIEVLRGPQGTMYGKNAIGGVINIISKEPGNQFESRITAEAAENESYRASFFTNGPIITDKFFFGLAGSYQETDGFMQNDNPAGDNLDEGEEARLKSRFKWTPTDRLAINLHTGLFQTRYGSGVGINAAEGVKYHEYKNPDDKTDSDRFDNALNIAYQGSGFGFDAITTFSHGTIDLRQDQSFANVNRLMPVSLRDTQTDSFSQEFRIKSPDKNEGMEWIGGLYYSQENSEWDMMGQSYNTASMFGYNILYNWPNDTTDQTMAAFGQVAFPLPGRLKLTTGLRYERVDKEVDYRYEVTRTDTNEILPADPFQPGNPTSVTYNIDDTWDVWLPKGALSWTVNNNVMLYTSVAKGYLAGGFNWCENVKEQAKFDEQSSIDYELGAKISWFDNRLIFNANLFYMDIKDMHVYYTPDSVTFITSNAAEAHSQGVEIELQARPLPGLDVISSFGLIDAEYDEYTNTAGIDCSGKALEGAPEYTLYLAVQYRHDSGFFSRISMQGYGEYYFEEYNSLRQKAFELYNAKIGYESSLWEVYLYGENLFDKEYFSFGRVNASGTIANVGSPRTFGVIASLRF